MLNAAKAAYGGVSDDLARAKGLPRSAFTDPDVFAAEVDQLFRTQWVPALRESEIATPGDQRPVDLFGVPLVATRDLAGKVHVLSRVCRHRGFPLSQEAGNAKGLTCPYHLWRYGLDGRFVAAPGMEKSEIFDPQNCDLPSYAVECWGGWVFVNLSGTAPPLAPQIEPVRQRLAEIAPETLVTADIISLTSPWNWKVMVENFLESYHHIGPHSTTLQRSNPGLGTYEGQGTEAFTILENPPAGLGHAHFVVAAVFPLMMGYFTTDPAPHGLWYEMADITRESFTLRVHLLTSPQFAAMPELVAEYRERVMVVHLEDIPPCEGVQQGVTSPDYQPGPLSHLEGSLWRFHRHLKARLGAE